MFALLDDALHSSVPLRDVVLYSRVNFKIESDIFPFTNPRIREMGCIQLSKVIFD
jgi:hypothetical protein